VKTVLAIFIMAVSLPAIADYEISWHTIDGGGGTSTGGDFALVGTIGQPDVGEMVGGDYQLSGGFWPRGPILSCFVNFEHFAELSLRWLDSPCNEGNNFCEGADLDFSFDVGLGDVRELAYWWLADSADNRIITASASGTAAIYRAPGNLIITTGHRQNADRRYCNNGRH
jgi:hypothetical protein